MPNRILKESICCSDSIDSLSWFEEVLFYRLIVNCDDYGRFDGRAAVIKSRLFPLRDNVTIKAVEAAMNKLVNADLVVLYVFEGKPYLHLPTWDKHQQVRAKRSKYPAPDGTCKHMISDDIKCNQMIANVPVIQSESESLSESNPKESAHARGEYGWVKLTDAQYSKLIADLGEAEALRCIRYVDESAQTTGNKNKWKDWNLTIRKCHRDGWGLKNQNVKPSQVQASLSGYANLDLDEYDKLMSMI